VTSSGGISTTSERALHQENLRRVTQMGGVEDGPRQGIKRGKKEPSTVAAVFMVEVMSHTGVRAMYAQLRRGENLPPVG